MNATRAKKRLFTFLAALAVLASLCSLAVLAVHFPGCSVFLLRLAVLCCFSLFSLRWLFLLFTFLCAGCSRCALSSLRWLFLFFKFLATGCSSCSLSQLFWCSLSLRWQELFPRCAGCSCCSQPSSRWLFLLLFNFRAALALAVHGSCCSLSSLCCLSFPLSHA